MEPLKFIAMDSKLIYIACGHVLTKYEWPRLGKTKDSSEWFFVGIGDEFRSTLVLEKLEELRKEATVYLLKGRNDSEEIPTDYLLRVIREKSGKTILMKTDYSIAVEFQREVCRVGFFKQ